MTRSPAPIDKSHRHGDRAGGVLLLSVATGCISLGYQVMWFRIYADRLGSTGLTFLLVLAAFIGGLGAGSLASEPLLARAGRIRVLRDPLVLVGSIELLIAVAAALTLVVGRGTVAGGSAFPYAPDSDGVYQPWLRVSLGSVIAVASMAVPTFLMGTTFPLLCRAFRHRAGFPSVLYGWNTLGACSGVLLAEFLLLPSLGQERSLPLLALLNVGVGLAFVALGRRRAPSAGDEPPPVSVRAAAAAAAPGALLAFAVLSGFVSGAIEVDLFRAVRFARTFTDAAMSFTSFWAIVAIFAASFTVRLLGRPRPALLRVALLGTLAAHALSWSSLFAIRSWFADHYVSWAQTHLPAHPDAPLFPLSASLWLLLAFTGTILFPAYYCASLLLPTVCNLVQERGGHLGRVYGANTLAFCAGAVLFTSAAPRVNLFYSVKLLFVVIAVGAALALFLRVDRRPSRVALAVAAVALAIACFAVPRDFDRRFFRSDEPPARYPVSALMSDGVHTTYVVAHPDGKILYFDSHPMSGTRPASMRYMRLMAHMPLLAQEDPERALLICFGVGNTARAIASHESVRAIDVVDLDDRVFATADEFADTNRGVRHDPRARWIHDDGRTFLRRTDEKYDLITSEPPPPRAAGVYRLYSVEYYREVLAHLTEQGMMTQWIPLPEVSREAEQRMVASFARVFPHALLFVGSADDLILMGGRQPFDANRFERNFAASPGASRDLGELSFGEPLPLLARILRADQDLRDDVRDVREISDQRNDLALVATDPSDPPRVPLDPAAIVRVLDAGRLDCGARLAEVLADPARFRGVVPDLPRVVASRLLAPR